jgi:hypothetical protein
MADPKRHDDFRVSAPQNGMSELRFKDGQRMQISEEMLDRLTNEKAAARRAQQAAEDKAKKDAETPGATDRIVGGLKRAGSAVMNDARKFGGEVSGMIPDEMKARAGSAWESAKRFDREAGDALNNPNINYGTLTTAIGKGVQSALEALKRGPQQGPGAIPSSPEDTTPPVY